MKSEFDFYNFAELKDELEEDKITAQEECFMFGYLTS